MYTIDQIHTAALDLLKAKGSKVSALARTIDTFHGEVQDILDQASQLIVAMPACWVLYAGSTFEGQTNQLQDNFNLMVVYMVKELRSDVQKATMYALLEAGKKDLHGNNLGLYINPLKPVAIRQVKITREYAVYSHQLQTFFKT